MLRRIVLFSAAVANLLLIDQVVKAASVSSLKEKPPVEVLPNLFNLAYVENRGCAWGMFQGHVWPLAVFAVIAMGLLIWKRKSVFPRGGWGVKSINSSALSLLHSPTLTSIHDHRKNHSLD